MLERLRSLSENRSLTPTPSAILDAVERGSESDIFRGAPTTIEPLPPATDLLPEDARPTVKDMRGVPTRMPQRAPTTDAATSKLERVAEPTPAPLPPSPEAEEAASHWFEQVPTSPAGADFAPLAGGMSRTSITPVQARTGAQMAMPYTTPVRRPVLRQGFASEGAAPPWMLMALLSVTSLAVGMVLGALLFGDSSDVPILAPLDAGVCAPCAATIDAAAPPPTEAPRKKKK